MPTKSNSLSAILTGAARNCWLALDEDETKIVGRGETLNEAVEAAKENGIDDPIVIWSPKTWAPSVFWKEYE
jgi:hypothetical protein